MQTLWAPWRMQYIRASHPEDEPCFLCQMRDVAAPLRVAAGVHCGVCMNRYPYSSGHLMVFPFRHVATLDMLDDAEKLEFIQLADRAVQVLNRVMRPEGFNIGINLGPVAGAGLSSHLHMHVVPRWLGDANFMSVTAETRVIPQDLGATRDALTSAWGSDGVAPSTGPHADS